MAGDLFSTLSSGQPYDYSAAFCDSERFNCQRFKKDSRSETRHRKGSFPWITPSVKRSSSEIHAQRNARRSQSRLSEQQNYELFSVEEKAKNSPTSDTEKGLGSRKNVTISDVVGGTDDKTTSSADSRMLAQRVSLLGRPIEHTPNRHRTRDQRIRKYQFLVHNFLERPRGKIQVSYHIFQ